MITPIEDLQTPSCRQSVMQYGEIKQIELQNRSQKSKTSTRKLIQKPEQTIQVLSDEEEEQIISEKFQEQVLKAKIEEAKLTKSKHTILKVLYMELNFRNKKQNEKENRFNSMVRMYISKNLKTSRGQPFDMRISYFYNQMLPKSGESFVQNEYLLYGCDLLPHKHIEKMFNFYSPSIKWIDASHCRLTFMTKIHGWDAVINNCLQFEYLKKYILANEKVEQLMDKLQLQGERQMEQQHETKYTEEYFKLQKFKKEYHVLKEYIELMPYYELGFKRRIFMRNVTSSEQLIGYDLSGESKSENEVGEIKSNNQEKKKKESEYKKYLRVKDALWRQIQNSPLVKPQYDKIEKDIHRQQEILKYAKRPTPTYQNKPSQRSYQNSNIRNQNFTRRGNYNNIYQPPLYNNDQYSHKNSYNPEQYQARNRSRSRSRDYHFYQRNYPTEGQAYQGRNSYGQKHNKFIYRNDQLEKAFEEYIGQRDEVVVIQNPHRYLQPEFVDNRTGLHFYRNPFYNPPIQAQPNFPNYEYQDAPDQYQTPTPAYDYGSQSIPNPNISGYEYDGNTNNQQNLNPIPYDPRLTNSQINSSKKDFRQRANSRHSIKSSKTSQSAEEMFNNYCVQRDNNITEEKGLTNQNQQQLNNYDGQFAQSQSDPNQHLFDPQEFSIITQQKTHNPKGNSPKLIEQNLENILDQLLQDQTSVNLIESNQISNAKNIQVNQKGHVSVYENDDDSEDLEFMLRERQDFHIKKETVKQEHQSQKINNCPQGFIEEKIKEEHIPKWFKSNPFVDDSLKLSNLAVKSQKAPEVQSNFEEIVSEYPAKTPSESSQNIKKKIHVKKARDSSSSKSKRQGQSQTKKTRN